MWQALVNFMKILHVIFSTNRINYLEKTLYTQEKYLDFSGLEVHKLLIDDYPLNRDDSIIINLAKKYNFKEIILHPTNLGITSTWAELFSIIKSRNYDYILHQEDDVEPLQHIYVKDIVEILENNKDLSQIQLKRNVWYPDEVENLEIYSTDKKIGDYYLETGSPWFWMLMSIYPKWVSEIDFVKETGFNPAEFTIAKHLKEKYNLTAGILKTNTGSNLVNHFGEISKGIRVNPGEPGWDKFKYYDPNKQYYSRTGHEYRNSSN